MKRVLAFLLAMMLALSLCACGSKENLAPADPVSPPVSSTPEPSKPTEPSAPEKPTEPTAPTTPEKPAEPAVPEEPAKPTNRDGAKCSVCGNWLTDWAATNQGCGVVVFYQRNCPTCQAGFFKEEMVWHTLEDGKCTQCGKSETDPANLQFKLNEAGTGYELIRVTFNHQDPDLIVPRMYNDLPVVGIQSLIVDRQDNLQPHFIYLQNTATYLKDNALKKLGCLEGVWMADSVTSLGNYALAANQSLRHLRLSENLSEMGMYVFASSGLQEVTLPDNLTKLGVAAFAQCKSLRTVKIGSRLQDVGEAAFAQCTALETVEMPNSVTTIGNTAFYLCSALERFELPKKVTVVPTDCFADCTALTTVVWHDDITTIGSGAFSHCPISELPLLPRLTTIGSGAFRECKTLTAVTLPQGLSTIEANAFYACTSLTSANRPDTLSTIGKDAFYCCPVEELFK